MEETNRKEIDLCQYRTTFCQRTKLSSIQIWESISRSSIRCMIWRMEVRSFSKRSPTPSATWINSSTASLDLVNCHWPRWFHRLKERNQMGSTTRYGMIWRKTFQSLLLNDPTLPQWEPKTNTWRIKNWWDRSSSEVYHSKTLMTVEMSWNYQRSVSHRSSSRRNPRNLN